MKQEVIFKRKYRWTFEAEYKDIKTEPHFVKVSARPEIKHTDDPDYKSGDTRLEPITTTFFDAGHMKDVDKLYQLIALFYDFGSKSFAEAKSPKDVMEKTKGNLGTGTLILYDGCGWAMEKWTLLDLWPQSINFGDLCYSSSDEVDIDITWRFLDLRWENMIEKGLEQQPWGRPSWPSSGTMGLGNLGIGPNIIF